MIKKLRFNVVIDVELEENDDVELIRHQVNMKLIELENSITNSDVEVIRNDVDVDEEG